MVVLVLAGCTADGGLIYSTIETATKTTTGADTARLTATVSDLVLAPVANTYYVASGTIYQGVLSSGALTWTPSGTSQTPVFNPDALSLANALVYVPSTSTWWGGFTTSSASLGIYKASGNQPSTWAAETDTNVAGKQVMLLRVANNNLFMSGGTLAGSPVQYQYELDVNTGSGWTAPTVTGLANPITGVAWDGTRYYYSSGALVNSDTSANGAFATTEATGAASTDTVNGLFGDPARSRVFALTTSEGLYYRVSGGAWTQVAAPTVSSVTVSLLSLAGPVDSAGNVYLVGTDGYGFYTLTLNNNTLTRSADSTIALYTGSVRNILVDPSNGTVLMGTNGLGVWSATFDTTGALATAWTHD